MKIAVAENWEQALLNRGVGNAIAYAFFNPGVVFKEDSVEYAEIARAYFGWVQHDLLMPSLKDPNHRLCSGRSCTECRNSALPGLVDGGHAMDQSQAAVLLTRLIADARSRSLCNGCSMGVCEVQQVLAAFARPNVEANRHGTG